MHNPELESAGHDRRDWKAQFSDVIPWGFVALLAVATFAIGLRNRSLRAEFLQYRHAELRLKGGEYVPPFSGRATTGDSLVVGASRSGRQLLIVLTTTCPYCAQSLPNWKMLYNGIRTGGGPPIEVVALTTDSLRLAKVYADSNALPFPLVPIPSPAYVHAYKAALVPQTLVVDPDGLVVFSRSGALNTRSAVDSIMTALRQPQAQPKPQPTATSSL